MLGFNDTSTLEGHFVSSPREREKRDRRESRGDEREGQTLAKGCRKAFLNPEYPIQPFIVGFHSLGRAVQA